MSNLNSMRPDICVTKTNNKTNKTKWFSANQDYDELYKEIAEFVGKLDNTDFQIIAMDNFGKWEPTKFQSHDLHLILPFPCSLNFVTDYAEYKGWSGTSISAPRVTGLIARMLEVVPLLGMEAIIDCLIRECR